MKTVISINDEHHIGKQTIEQFANDVVNNCDPIYALGVAKMLAQAAKDIEARTKDEVLEVIEMSGAKSVEVGGAMFTYANGRTTYDYSDIPEWMDIANQIECLTEECKELEKGLKGHEKAIEKKGAASVRVTFR
jgi:hypothetical protein